MSKIPEHLRNPHLSAWSLGLTVAGCCLAVFSPVAINKNPQWAIAGTATGGMLSAAGWIMGCQSEKSSKLQAKIEEITEAAFLREIGITSELQKTRDAVYLERSQQAIIRDLPPTYPPALPPQPYQPEETERTEGRLALMEREEEIEVLPVPEGLDFYNWENLADEASGILVGGNSGSAKTSLGAGFIVGKLTAVKPAEVIVLDIHASKNPLWQQMGFPRIESDLEKIYDILCWFVEEVETRKERDGHQIIICLDEINDTLSELQQLDITDPLPGREKRTKTFSYAIRKLSNARKFDICLIGFMQSHNTEAIGIDGKFRNNFLLVLCGASARSEVSNLWKHDDPRFLYIQNAPYPVVISGSNPVEIAQHPTHKHHAIYRKKGNAPANLISPRFLKETSIPTFTSEKNLVPVPSPVINLKKADIPEVLQEADPLNPSTWQSVNYPSGLQWLPQYEAGIYAVFVDGYQNPLYVGQSKDLWRRWNNSGDWEHHIKKNLDAIRGTKTKISYYITKGWDDQKRLSLESELQIKYQTPWNGTANKSLPQKTLSEAGQEVYRFIKESFTGEPIPARDCYRKSSLRTQFGLSAETTEQIFEELQSFGLGEKLIKEVNGFRSVNFLPSTLRS